MLTPNCSVTRLASSNDYTFTAPERFGRLRWPQFRSVSLRGSLPDEAARRNVVTRGVPLNHLVGREFQIGAVRLRGTRLCEPCAYLEGLTLPGVLAGLIHRGGLRAEIVTGGTIRVEDAITE